MEKLIIPRKVGDAYLSLNNERKVMYFLDTKHCTIKKFYQIADECKEIYLPKKFSFSKDSIYGNFTGTYEIDSNCFSSLEEGEYSLILTTTEPLLILWGAFPKNVTIELITPSNMQLFKVDDYSNDKRHHVETHLLVAPLDENNTLKTTTGIYIRTPIDSSENERMFMNIYLSKDKIFNPLTNNIDFTSSPLLLRKKHK